MKPKVICWWKGHIWGGKNGQLVTWPDQYSPGIHYLGGSRTFRWRDCERCGKMKMIYGGWKSEESE